MGWTKEGEHIENYGELGKAIEDVESIGELERMEERIKAAEAAGKASASATSEAATSTSAMAKGMKKIVKGAKEKKSERRGGNEGGLYRFPLWRKADEEMEEESEEGLAALKAAWRERGEGRE